ncbi:hypothetical protein RHSIM_Rhsim07G0147300 [Rhododendron simsii]|uniref:Uncharacterized protein n=1 Tax=Rhododendron simsii TaxID=118357 RepID=A0A834GUP3_RHOSS|nr:hypothetical protein RHSIM_Rhsim07G0147300 [Rhododendron simsii]
MGSEPVNPNLKVVSSVILPNLSPSLAGIETPPQNPNLSDPQNFGVHSPKRNNSSLARKLQQVFQQERRRLDTEARVLEIVGHLEDELNNSEDPLLLDVVTAKLQSIQQSWRKAEAQSKVVPPPSVLSESYMVKASKPRTTLYNARGISYLEGDPNMGFPATALKPRYQPILQPNPIQSADKGQHLTASAIYSFDCNLWKGCCCCYSCCYSCAVVAANWEAL